MALQHEYDVSRGWYNRTPATMHQIRARLAKPLYQSASCNCLLVSDSTFGGYPGSTPYVYETNPLRSMAKALNGQFGMTWQQGLQYAKGDKNVVTGLADNWAVTGSFSTAPNSMFLFGNGAGTATRSALSGEVGDTVEIYYSDLGTNAIPVKIDGSTVTALATSATNTIRKATYTVTSGTHTIQIAPTAGQNVTIIATRIFTAATKALNIHNLSFGGSRINGTTGSAVTNDLNWSSTSNSGTYGLGWVMPNLMTAAGITPDFIIMSLGGNDISAGADPAVTAASITTVQAYWPSVPVLYVHAHKVSTVTDAAYNAYSNALYAEMDTLNLPMFDWNEWEGLLAGAAADGLIGTDGTHPTPVLQQMVGRQIANFLQAA